MKNVGTLTENFKDMIDKDFYLVDKTLFIRDFLTLVIKDKLTGNLSNVGMPVLEGVNLILRPRRFGKTLMLSTLRYFFDLDEKNNSYLFEGLAISREKELCDKFQNKFPVISITLKNVNQRSKEDFLEAFNYAILNEYTRHSYLREFITVKGEAEIFDRLMNLKGNAMDIQQSLSLLAKYLHKFHGVKPLILIDEYDVPLNAAHSADCFDYVVDIIKNMFSSALKTNDDIQAAVITGCLQIAKNQIYTGLNNVKVYPVTERKYSTAFGFTEKETEVLLDYYGLMERANDVKAFYDGYEYGKEAIYNPYSVINFVGYAVGDRNKPCTPYWANSSGNSLLMDMLSSIAEDKILKNDFESLLDGKAISVDVDSTITYESMLESRSAIMGTLLYRGYLTPTKKKTDAEIITDNADSYPSSIAEQMKVNVKIPNAEVMACFSDIVSLYNEKIIKQPNNELFNAFINNLPLTVNSLLEERVMMMLGNNEFGVDREYAPHLFLLGNLVVNPSSGWRVESERCHGDGRPDITIVNERNKIAIIIEIKYAKRNDRKNLDDLVNDALSQIEEKQYDYAYKKYDMNISKWGIAFKGKSVKAVLA